MIVHGKAIFTCPKTGKEVNLAVECLNPDHKGTQCIFFKHWSWTSAHPWICCDYKQEQQQTEEKPQEEEPFEKEPEGEGEEKAWRQPQFIQDE